MIEWIFETVRRRRLRQERLRWERQRPRTPMERMLATAALLRASQARPRR